MFEFGNFNLPAAILFILVVAGIVALTYYKMKKNNKEYSIDKFLNDNYYNLISALSDVIQILLIKVSDYPTKEAYEEDIIRETVNKLYKNSEVFGINPVLLNMVDTETLTKLLYRILKSEKVAIFINAVPKDVIQENPNLYDEEVVNEANNPNSEVRIDLEDCDKCSENVETDESYVSEDEVVEADTAIDGEDNIETIDTEELPSNNYLRRYEEDNNNKDVEDNDSNVKAESPEWAGPSRDLDAENYNEE